MKENIKYFETILETNGYIINDTPFTGYIKENGLVIFNNEPNKMLINLNGLIIIHEVVNIVFETLNEANGYIIETIPFNCYIKENLLFLECDEPYKKIIIENNKVVLSDPCILKYNAISKLESRANNLGNVIIHRYDNNTGDGIVIYRDDIEVFSGFNSCKELKRIVTPKSIIRFPDTAFGRCNNLTSLVINGNENCSIGDRLLIGCDNLTSVIWNVKSTQTVFENGKNIFRRDSSDSSWRYNISSNIKFFDFGQDVRIIPGYVAYSLSYASNTITIPDHTEKIGERALYECLNVFSVIIPNSVIRIGDYAFYNIKNIIYNGSATGSPWGAQNVNGFIEGDLIYTDITKSKLIMCNRGSVYTEIVLPNGINTIGAYAFRCCYNIDSLIIPETVTSIETRAISSPTDSEHFNSITCKAIVPPVIMQDSFRNETRATLYVPSQSVSAYQSAQYWSEFTNIQAIPQS